MKKCGSCGEDFVPRRYNMIYCSPECCRQATNAKIVERYYQKKKPKTRERRLCSECPTVLSKYNDSNICYSCINKIEKANREKLLNELLYINVEL
jgi:hypothetical protein